MEGAIVEITFFLFCNNYYLFIDLFLKEAMCDVLYVRLWSVTD